MTFIPSTEALASTSLGVGKNRVINGEMRIDQPNGGTVTTVSGGGVAFGPDMLVGASAGGTAGTFTIQQSTSTPPTGFTHFTRITCTVADSSISATDEYDLRSDIEGNNVRDLNLGTAAAKTFTLSFWVRSSLTGIYCATIQNNAQNRSYVFEYTINSANTWEQKSVTIPGDTTGTWLTDTSVGLRIRWCYAAGTNYQTTANTWSAGQFFDTSNQVNFMSSNSSRTWDLTGVQLEIGTVATAFEYRPFVVEVAFCQRYFEKSYPLGVATGTATTSNDVFTPAAGGTGQSFGSYLPFKVTKRTNPTISLWTTAGTSGKAEWGTLGTAFTERVSQGVTSGGVIPIHGFSISQAVNATDNGCAFHYAADARM